jgi:hypothetical protein
VPLRWVLGAGAPVTAARAVGREIGVYSKPAASPEGAEPGSGSALTAALMGARSVWTAWRRGWETAEGRRPGEEGQSHDSVVDAREGWMEV